MLLVLGIFFLLFSPALPLKCYVCSSSATNEECNQSAQECKAPLNTCMTVVDTLDTATAITKQCASQATCRGAASTASVDSNGNGNAVSCCSTYDFCNFSGADSINRNTKLLLLTVGVGFLLSC
ncbi:prostate stem cell antigen-like [Oreochromis aureus]|uniref:prostate stem cell antigen-like n=1 Tax=Oreochromis aureus TaxID=47969 RepID=UPI0012BC72CE|nr:prostate stem cell antigen-like [Oreochromis aureus]